MSEDRRSPTNLDLLTAWLDSASGFYGQVLRSWTPAASRPTDGESSEAPPPQAEAGGWGRAQESAESLFRTWQSLSSAAAQPGGLTAGAKLGQAVPEIFQHLVQATWNSLFHVNQQWLERAGRIGRSSQARTIQSLDEETFEAWREIYEQEFQKFFYMPQLGLHRFYQEKLNASLDKSSRTQALFADFMVVFLRPMHESARDVQQEFARRIDAGDPVEDHDVLYRDWIRMLERAYMKLFRTPEYLAKLSELVSALSEFLAARNELLHDALKTMAVPSTRELDDMYREMYELKKRLRRLEKSGSAS